MCGAREPYSRTLEGTIRDHLSVALLHLPKAIRFGKRSVRILTIIYLQVHELAHSLTKDLLALVIIFVH